MKLTGRPLAFGVGSTLRRTGPWRDATEPVTEDGLIPVSTLPVTPCKIHTITELSDGNGFMWGCDCGMSGAAPTTIGIYVLGRHLAGK